MAKKILKFLLLTLLVLVLCAGLLLTFTAATDTAEFTDEHGNVIASSIAEERMMRLGGVDQHVLLRGENATAPLLVYVHGGPGMTSTPFLRTHNAELEKHFVMVYWEQRGANKSFSENLDAKDMTIKQITNDLGQLVETLRNEFKQDKIMLVGHSWGTIPALEFAAEKPQWVAAYVSVAQTANQLESDKLGYLWALEKAKKKNYSKSVSTLEELGPPPYSYEEFVTQRTQVNFLGGGMLEPISDLGFAWIAIKTDEFSWKNLGAVVSGVKFSGEALWEEQQRYDAFERHSKLDVPLYMLAGRHDRVISSELGKAYFDAVSAPGKQFIWFDNSAHAPQFEEPNKFNESIVRIGKEIGLLKPADRM